MAATPVRALVQYVPSVPRGALERLRPAVEPVGLTWAQCTSHQQPLAVAFTGRSMWYRGFDGGPGAVLLVGEPYCPACGPAPALPAFGAPVYDDELIPLAAVNAWLRAPA